MQLGMIGLGRMGANMVRRLLKGGHECVIFDINKGNMGELAREGATHPKILPPSSFRRCGLNLAVIWKKSVTPKSSGRPTYGVTEFAAASRPRCALSPDT